MDDDGVYYEQLHLSMVVFLVTNTRLVFLPSSPLWKIFFPLSYFFPLPSFHLAVRCTSFPSEDHISRGGNLATYASALHFSYWTDCVWFPHKSCLDYGIFSFDHHHHICPHFKPLSYLESHSA